MAKDKYVIDTNVFIRLREYPEDVFASLWSHIDTMIKEGRLTSVSEVYKELTVSDGKMTEWAKANKEIFPKPTLEEQMAVMEILQEFPLLIKENNRLTGRPEADPFVIAKGMVEERTVVTMERFKPQAPKMPNVCEHFGVAYLDLLGFFRQEGWKF